MTTSARKKVSVTFAGDDDVIKHIVCSDDCTTDRRLRKNIQKVSKSKSISEKPESEGDSDEESLATPLFGPIQDDNVFVQGADLFHFKSTKKSDQMIQKAQESRTPKSKSRKGNQTPKARRLSQNTSVKPVSQKTPVKQTVRKLETTTPFRLRKRNHVEGDDFSDASIESSSEDEEEVIDKHKEDNSVAPRQPSRQPVMEDANMTGSVEDYFQIQSGGPGPTSDRTLAKLSRMSENSLSEILSNVLTSHKTECSQLVAQHGHLFRQWMYQLSNGFNLLMYGLGSKRSLLEEFRKRMLGNFTHLVVNGYFPSLTIKQILNSITESILEHTGNFRNPLDQLEFIKDHYSSQEYEDVYILINNIDGSMLRAEKAQAVLSLLSQIRGFHIIASLDHINSPLIWDKMKCSRFNWLWYDVTTYIPYTEETSYENSLLVQQTGALALSSLTHVLRSLTLNARRIFLLLVHFQMENKPGNPAYSDVSEFHIILHDLSPEPIKSGDLQPKFIQIEIKHNLKQFKSISFRDMYQKCRENFLVNSDLTLRTQLTEFRDHKLITSKKGHDGMEYLLIPVETATLSEFLESQEEALTAD